MMRYRLGIIKVLTRENPTPDWINNHGRMIEMHYPDIRTETRVISDQPEGIHDQASQSKAEPKIEALAKDFVSEGVDAIFVSCAADPAVEKIHTWCPVPVIGAGRPVALMALAMGDPVGVLGLSSEPLPSLSAVLGDRLCGSAAPEGVTTANDLYVPGAETFFTAPARRLILDGARSIALACTGFATLGTAAKLSKILGVPVVDPVLAAGAVVRFMMYEKQTNL